MNPLWVLSRATGLVSLVLLTLVMVIGILVQRQRRVGTLPRFVVVGLHRNASLLGVAFVAVHAAATPRPSRPVMSLPVPTPWASATGQQAYAAQCTARQARRGTRCRSRLVSTRASIRSRVTAPRPSQNGR